VRDRERGDQRPVVRSVNVGRAQDVRWCGRTIISVSPGALGGFGANHHLRQSLVFVNMPAMHQPEAYIGAAATLFDQDGLLASVTTRDYVSRFLDAFGRWIDNVKRR
jgi:chromate reductase, NAD(P)H dehydrogenase (quinone)